MDNSIEELGLEITKHKLWQELFEKFEVAYSHNSKHVDKQSLFNLFCKNCGPTAFTLTFTANKKLVLFNCNCCGYSSNDFNFVDLILKASPLKRVTAKKIIGGAVELLVKRQQELDNQKQLADTRMKSLGVYSFNESARKVGSKKSKAPVRPTKPRKSSKVKPVRPKSLDEGCYQIWK